MILKSDALILDCNCGRKQGYTANLSQAIKHITRARPKRYIIDF
jgi:hypothetical protein